MGETLLRAPATRRPALAEHIRCANQTQFVRHGRTHGGGARKSAEAAWSDLPRGSGIDSGAKQRGRDSRLASDARVSRPSSQVRTVTNWIL